MGGANEKKRAEASECIEGDRLVGVREYRVMQSMERGDSRGHEDSKRKT